MIICCAVSIEQKLVPKLRSYYMIRMSGEVCNRNVDRVTPTYAETFLMHGLVYCARKKKYVH